MARIIGVLNFKGGTGKTTTVVNLGMGLALAGHRVLAIDLDGQGSLANCLGVAYDKTVGDILLNEATWPECIVRARTRFDIIPADRRLAEAEHKIIAKQEQADFLSRQLAGIDQVGYDYILLDCAPSVSLISESVLRFAQEIFAPVSMEYLAVMGVRMVIIEIMRTRRLIPGQVARLSLVIPTFYERRYKKSAATLEILRRHFAGLVSDPIRASVRFSEAPSHHLTIFEYDPLGPGSVDYARLAERVANNA